MRKEIRDNMLSPIEENYSIYEIDFNSFEPSFFLSSTKSVVVEDIYEWISKEISFSGSREDIKQTVISTLYGANPHSISANNIKKIRDLFEIEKFTEELEKEHNENGFIHNAWGRPIFGSNNLLSKWTQSSAADYAHLAFDLLCSENRAIQPIAVIHDAFLFQIESKNEKCISEIKMLKENISEKSLYVKVKRVA
jgi:hypothetical protein